MVSAAGSNRQTAADLVYERLHADIVTLKLLPGEKLSEGEIARQLEVSRQPVREAFIRLHNLELLLVQPQRSTEVRRISERSIRNARFVRLAVEIEVVRLACTRGVQSYEARFRTNLKQQQSAIKSGNTSRFQELDYKFHRLICQAADCEHAYETIESSKSQIERLCLLALSDAEELAVTFEDHCQLFEFISGKQTAKAASTMRKHLQRLDAVVEAVKREHTEYFQAE